MINSDYLKQQISQKYAIAFVFSFNYITNAPQQVRFVMTGPLHIVSSFRNYTRYFFAQVYRRHVRILILFLLERSVILLLMQYGIHFCLRPNKKCLLLSVSLHTVMSKVCVWVHIYEKPGLLYSKYQTHVEDREINFQISSLIYEIYVDVHTRLF